MLHGTVLVHSGHKTAPCPQWQLHCPSHRSSLSSRQALTTCSLVHAGTQQNLEQRALYKHVLRRTRKTWLLSSAMCPVHFKCIKNKTERDSVYWHNSVKVCPLIPEAEAGRRQVQVQPGQLSQVLSQNKNLEGWGRSSTVDHPWLNPPYHKKKLRTLTTGGHAKNRYRKSFRRREGTQADTRVTYRTTDAREDDPGQLRQAPSYEAFLKDNLLFKQERN